MDFFVTLFQTSFIFILMVIVAAAGLFTGRFLRKRKDRKEVSKIVDADTNNR